MMRLFHQIAALLKKDNACEEPLADGLSPEELR